MWILNFLPDSFLILVVHAITLLGIIGLTVGFFLGFLPFIGMHSRVIKIVSTVILLAGVYLQGGLSTEMEWRKRVAEMEEKVKLLEQESKKINNELDKKIAEKTTIIKEKGKKQIEYINRLVEGKTVEIVKDMSEKERQEFLAKQTELQEALKNCPVPKIIVEEHNKAAEKK